jgi:hypothetical protein
MVWPSEYDEVREWEGKAYAKIIIMDMELKICGERIKIARV